jgi:hypothetical protein
MSNPGSFCLEGSCLSNQSVMKKRKGDAQDRAIMTP